MKRAALIALTFGVVACLGAECCGGDNNNAGGREYSDSGKYGWRRRWWDDTDAFGDAFDAAASYVYAKCEFESGLDSSAWGGCGSYSGGLRDEILGSVGNAEKEGMVKTGVM